jgi:prepilin-type N-terminal cleavage/methylation domain-containing protein
MTLARHRRQTAGGFTLLEVMIALAILSLSLVVLLRIVTNNIRATNHAKMTTAATFLARSKMVDIEDLILDNGFSESDENEAGTFKDMGYPAFRWETAIERIELPTDMAQKSKDKATDSTREAQDNRDPMSMLTGFLGGMMSSFIEPIRVGLQDSVRRVTVRVFWWEIGRPEQTFEVVQYLTDPAKLDANLLRQTAGATQGGPGGGTGAAQMPGLGGIMAPAAGAGSRR